LARTTRRLSGHETYMMSTRGAHYVGPVSFGARVSGGGGGLGVLKQVATAVLAASARTRRRHGAHEIHIMSTRSAHHVDLVRFGARGEG
jgi:hypothetical protein